jgi:hypothetical protein
MFNPKEHWMSFLERKKREVEPKIEIYEEWELVLEGTTIKGRHLHIYKNKITGLLDWSEE